MNVQTKIEEVEELISTIYELKNKGYEKSGYGKHIGKFIGICFLILMIIFYVIEFLVKYTYLGEYELIISYIFSIIFILNMVVIIVFHFRERTKYSNKSIEQKIQRQKELERLNEELDSLYSYSVNKIKSSELQPINLNSKLILKNDEIPLMEYLAERIISKEKIISYRSQSYKPIFASNENRCRATSENISPIVRKVDEVYSGNIVLTNKRIVFLSTENGFEIDISELTSIEVSSDMIHIQVNESNYIIVSKISLWLESYLERLLQTNNM